MDPILQPHIIRDLHIQLSDRQHDALCRLLREQVESLRDWPEADERFWWRILKAVEVDPDEADR